METIRYSLGAGEYSLGNCSQTIRWEQVNKWHWIDPARDGLRPRRFPCRVCRWRAVHGIGNALPVRPLFSSPVRPLFSSPVIIPVIVPCRRRISQNGPDLPAECRPGPAAAARHWRRESAPRSGRVLAGRTRLRPAGRPAGSAVFDPAAPPRAPPTVPPQQKPVPQRAGADRGGGGIPRPWPARSPAARAAGCHRRHERRSAGGWGQCA